MRLDMPKHLTRYDPRQRLWAVLRLRPHSRTPSTVPLGDIALCPRAGQRQDTSAYMDATAFSQLARITAATINAISTSARAEPSNGDPQCYDCGLSTPNGTVVQASFTVHSLKLN
jgi:hypothetical protein